MKWLFNFSASPVGGGRRRLEETAKWFELRGGATFLIPEQLQETMSRDTPHNRYIGVSQSKLTRLLADGRYLGSVLSDTGTPDVFFSYGIPLFGRVGKINWLHATNALTLTVKRHGMPIRRYIEHQVLGRRIKHSLRHAQIASAESKFSLGLLRSNDNPGLRNCRFLVLGNGCDSELLSTVDESPLQSDYAYAVTIGTAPYKRLHLVRDVFYALRTKHPELERLKIIGNRLQIPNDISNDLNIEGFDSGFSNSQLYGILRKAEYYISASEIENSSIAALEALLLSRKIALSDIPSHREATLNLPMATLDLPNAGRFLIIDGAKNRSQIRPLSWDDVVSQMSHTVSALMTNDR